MWSSRKVLVITALIAAVVAIGSAVLNRYIALLLAPLAAHIASVASGYLYYRVRGCPEASLGGEAELSTKDRRVVVRGSVAQSESSISSTLYVIRGRRPPLVFLLHPVLLCIFSYFSPLKLAGDVYEAYGAMPGTVYIFRSRIGGRISEQDIRELYRTVDRICGAQRAQVPGPASSP